MKSEIDRPVELTMFDGPPAKDDQLPDLCLTEQLPFAKKYLDYSKVNVNVHAANINWLTREAAIELEKATNWLNEKINVDSIYIATRFVDGNKHGASVKPLSSPQSSSREYLIRIRLGGIPLLFGIANRLQLISSNLLLGALATGNTNVDAGYIEWDPETEPMGSITWEPDTLSGLGHTLQIVQDSLLLMFFHEAAHACAGHPYMYGKHQYSLIADQYRKAVEAEADWGAGQLFIKFHTDTGKIEGSELCRRMVFAAKCNYLALQVARGEQGRPDSKYHTPNTRTQCTVAGGEQAWSMSNSVSGDYVEMTNESANSIYFAEKLFRKAIKGWLPFDSNYSKLDFESLVSVSWPLLKVLKESNKVKRAKAFDELPWN